MFVTQTHRPRILVERITFRNSLANTMMENQMKNTCSKIFFCWKGQTRRNALEIPAQTSGREESGYKVRKSVDSCRGGKMAMDQQEPCQHRKHSKEKVPIYEATGWLVFKGCKLMNMECCNRCFFGGSWFIEKEGPWCNTWMFGAPLSTWLVINESFLHCVKLFHCLRWNKSTTTWSVGQLLQSFQRKTRLAFHSFQFLLDG